MTPQHKIRRILRVSGMTQDALAKRVGVSLISINTWAMGKVKPRSKALAKIDEIAAELTVGTFFNSTTLFESETSVPNLSPTSNVPELSTQQRDRLLDGIPDAETIEVLRAAHLAEVLGNLSQVVDYLPPGAMNDAIHLLDRAKRAHATAWQELFTYPHIGLWAAACLQQVIESEEGEIPSFHIRHFALIAAVAAWKSGVSDFAIEVPVYDGAVVLPSLGRALLSDRSQEKQEETASLICSQNQLRIETAGEGGVVFIPSDPAHATIDWEPIRTITLRTQDLVLELAIDDIDPYRCWKCTVQQGIPHARLDQLDFKAWKEVLTDAWEMLVENHRSYAIGIAAGLTVVVPVQPGVDHVNAFSRGAFGAIASTIGANPQWMAHSMIEGFQRTQLHAFHQVDTIYTATNDTAGYYAPFNMGALSFGSLVEGAYAIDASEEFWRTRFHQTAGEEAFEAALTNQSIRNWQIYLLQRLKVSGEMTQLGLQMLSRIRERINRIDENIPLSITELARGVMIDNRLSYRIKNVIVAPQLVEDLADAWISGTPCPVGMKVDEYVISVDRFLAGRKLRRSLECIRIQYPEQFEDILDNEHYLQLVVPGASIADAHAVAGNVDKAIELYLDAIERNHDDDEAWAGLATVCARAASDASSSLGRFPEVVIALHGALLQRLGTSPDPLRLAKWLEPILVRMDEFAFENRFLDNDKGRG